MTPFSPPFALILSDQRDYAEAKALVLRVLTRCVQCRRVMFFCWEPNSNSTFSWYCTTCLGPTLQAIKAQQKTSILSGNDV